MRRPPAIVLVLLVASCGAQECRAPEQGHLLLPVDAGTVDAGWCNLLTQTGCSSGEQCTWIIDEADATSLVGHIGCAPAGFVPSGACLRNVPGASGYDNCAKGSYCFGPATGGPGVCKTICDQAGGAPQCSTDSSCVTYDGLFGPYGMPVAAGVCEPICDPLADNNFLGSSGNSRTGTACGSAGSAVGSGFLYALGCYGLPAAGASTHWTCAEQQNYSRFHRTACDSTQHVGDHATCLYSSLHDHANGCASGYEPLYLDYEGTTQETCFALCAPATCYNTGSGSSAGSASCGSGSSANITGTAPYQCVAQRLQYSSFDEIGSAGSNNGEQCFYSWVLEQGSGLSVFAASPTSDTVGFCLDHSLLKYDPTGGSNDTTEWPRCDQIGLGSNGYKVVNRFDAAAFGCVDTATARAAGDILFQRPAIRAPYASRAGRR